MYTVPGASGSEQPTENPTESLGTRNTEEKDKPQTQSTPVLGVDLSQDEQQPAVQNMPVLGVDLSKDDSQQPAQDNKPNPLDKAAQAAKDDTHQRIRPFKYTPTAPDRFGANPQDPDAGSQSTDWTRQDAPHLNPDYARTQSGYSESAQQGLSILASGKMPTLSSMPESEKAEFKRQMQSGNAEGIPAPLSDMVLPSLEGKVDDVLKNTTKVNNDITQNLNNTTLQSLIKKIKSEPKSEDKNKDIDKYSELLKDDIQYNIIKKYSGKDIWNEQISSDLQSEANNRKYEAFKSSGYANAVDKTLPSEVQDFLKSDEYLNSTVDDKKLYARMLYQNYVQKDGVSPNDFYAKIAKNITPPINAMLIKQIAQNLYQQVDSMLNEAIKKEYKANIGNPTDKYGLLQNSVSGDEVSQRLTRARDFLKSIINSDYHNESTKLDAAGNSMKGWRMIDAIPFLGQINGLRETVDDNYVTNKVQHNGEASLTPDEALLYKSHSMLNSFKSLSDQGATTKIFDALPTSLAFLLEFGATGAASEYSTTIIKGTMKKAATNLATKLAPGAIDTFRAVGDLSPSLTNAASRAIKAGDFVASKGIGYTTQTMLAQSGNVGKQMMENLAPQLTFSPQDINEQIHLTPNNETVLSALGKSVEQNIGQVAAVDVGRMFEFPQNKLLASLARRFPKASPWLNVLATNDLAEQVNKTLGDGATKINTLQEVAKKFGVGSLPGEMAAWGWAYPRFVNHIYGYQDDYLSHPIEQLQKDVSNMGGLVGPLVVGRAMSIGSSLYYRRAYASSFALNDFIGDVYNATPEKFSDQNWLSEMNQRIGQYATSSDKNNKIAARIMRSTLDRAQDHYSGGIEHGTGESTNNIYGSFKNYMDAAQEGQQHMNILIKSIKDGKPIDNSTIDDMKSQAADKGQGEEFQLHKDLLESYNQTPTTETIKQYVDKYKADYRNIDNSLTFHKELNTVPNFKVFSDKIDNLPLPESYKSQLRNKMNGVQEEYIAERKKYSIQENTAPELSPVFRIPGKGDDSHTFVRDNNGEYRLTSNNQSNFIPDITHQVSTMSNENVSALHNIVQNSNITQEQKNTITEAVKDKLVKSFHGVELFDQIGGVDNFGQILHQVNNIAKTSPLSDEQKTTLTNSIGGILSNELAKNYNPDNLQKVRSVLSTMLHNTNTYHPHEAINFFQNLSRQINRIENGRLTIDELTHKIVSGDKDALEELESQLPDIKDLIKENLDTLSPSVQQAINLIKNKDLKQSPDFENLIKGNKNIKKLSEAIDTLVKEEKISDNGKIVLQSFIAGLPIKHINLRSVNVAESEDEGTQYNPGSRTIKVRYGKNTTEAKIIADLAEELRHNIHHQLGLAVGNGGMIADFVMSDADIKSICGSNRIDAIANIARWYASKDYNYSDWLKLHSKWKDNRLQMTLEEVKMHDGITDMLDWFRNYFKQSDRYEQNFNTKNDVNPLGLNITSEQLINNYNRWKEFRELGHTPKFSAYYSLTAHEYFAKTFGDSDLQDVTRRLAGDKPIEGMINKMHDWASKYVKVPMLQRMFRSEVFSSPEAKRYLSKLISPVDLNNMIRVTETPDAYINKDVKDDIDRVAGSFKSGDKPIEQLREEYREKVLKQDLHGIDELYKQVHEACKANGHDSSFANDIMSQIIKDSVLTVPGFKEKEGKIIVDRHADTAEVDQKLNDSANEPLNDKGKEQAKEQGKEFKEKGITKIFHSPLQRAKETAAIAGEEADVSDMQERAGLETWNMGDFEGKPEKDFDEKYYVNHPDEKVPGGESFNEFKNRVLEEKEKLKTEADDKTGIIAHSKVMNLWNAVDKNNGEWNDKAKALFLKDKNVSQIKLDAKIEGEGRMIPAPNWNVGFKNMTDYLKDTQDVIHDADKESNDLDIKIGTFKDEQKKDVTYFSNVLRAIEKLPEDGKIDGKQILNKIIGSGGKLNEIQRYGLDEFLKEKKSVTKADLLDYMSDKVMKVKDTVLGGKVDEKFAELNREKEYLKNSLNRVGLREADYGTFISDDIQPGGDSGFEKNFLSTKHTDQENIDFINSHFNLPEFKDYSPSYRDSKETLKIYKDYVENYNKLDIYTSGLHDSFESNPTRYSAYTSFPLNNYRELLPTLEGEKRFSHNHFPDIQNQLYHNRINDVTTVSGKNLLLSEELQSDWTQKEPERLESTRDYQVKLSQLQDANENIKSIKDTGDEVYGNEIAQKNLKVFEDRKNKLEKELKSLEKERDKKQSPLQETSDWVRAAMRRMIKMAVDEDKDGIAWTPAHMQVERWSNSMRGVVDEIKYQVLKDKNYDYIEVNTYKDNKLTHPLKFYYTDNGILEVNNGATIDSYFGKKISDDILSGVKSQEKGSIKGDNITVGGEGYKDVYDRAAVDVVNKLVKQYGLKVGKESVNKKSDSSISVPNGDGSYSAKQGEQEQVHSLIFNDALKHDIGNQNEIPIGTFRGEHGLERMSKENPEEYWKLARQLELSRLSDEDPLKKFIKYGWFKEKLLGREFDKSEIDDGKMKFNELGNKYHSDIVNFALHKDNAPSEQIIKGRLENSPIRLPLESIIYHKELFDSYPELRSTPVKFIWDDAKNADGWYARDEKQITVNVAKVTNLGDTLLHEIQHHQQHEEGFWNGTSPEQFKDKLGLYNLYLLWRNKNKVVENIVDSNKNLKKDIIKIHRGEVPIGTDVMYGMGDDAILGRLNNIVKSLSNLSASDLYHRSLGEGEASNVGSRYSYPEFKGRYMPVTLAQTLGHLDVSELIPNKNSTSLSIGAYKDKSEYNPVDVAWFNELLKDKEGSVSTENVVKVIQSIDDSWYKYSENTQDAMKNASEKARDMVEMWKEQVLKTGLPEMSKYKRAEILRLLNTPFRKSIDGYLKDIAFIDKFVKNADFRNSFDEAQTQQGLARNRFLRNNKDNIPFYMAVSNLSKINIKMFDSSEQLKDFSALANTRIENTNIQDFIDKSNSLWKRYQEWKSQYNDQHTSEGVPSSTVEDNSPLQQEMLNMRRNLAVETLKTQFTNTATDRVHRDLIDAFTSIDPHTLTDKQFSQVKTGDVTYESILKQLLLNPSTADHKMFQFVSKLDASNWYEDSKDKLSDEMVKLINQKSLPSKITEDIATNIKSQVPFAYLPIVKLDGKWQWKTPDKLGNISFFNINSVFEIAEKFPKFKIGVLREAVTSPLDKSYQNYLLGLKNATAGLSPVHSTGFASAESDYSLASMHLIGMHGLLNQTPDLQLTQNSIDHLAEKGVDTEGLTPGLALRQGDGEAYDLLNQQVKEGIKKKILLSFGVKPSEDLDAEGNPIWSDEEMKAKMRDTVMKSGRTEVQIKQELDEILKQSEHEDLKTLVDNIANGSHALTEKEQSYLDLSHQRLQEVHDGVHSNGVTLPTAATVFGGVPFFHVGNYWPMLSYKSYSNINEVFKPNGEQSDDAKVFYGIYSDLHMNTGFLEKRKENIETINTNAYETLKKRIDDQVFYLNHIEHQSKLYDILKTPMFGGKGVFNTDATNFILGQLNGYFNRGGNPSLSKLRESPNWKQGLKWIDNYKAMVLGDIPVPFFGRGVSILSAAVFSMGKMEGGNLKGLQDMLWAKDHVRDSYIEGTQQEQFLKNNAMEVYARGLSAYDIATFSADESDKQSGLMNDFFSNRTKGVLSGKNRGLYTDERYGVANAARELNPAGDSQFGRELSLASIVFHHRLAARTAFFGLYKNYMDKIGEEVDFANANPAAVAWAINEVRETQNTDNPIHKSGVAYGNIAGGGDSNADVGFLAYNLLAFKSYAVNERQTLMKANQKMCNAFIDKDWNEFGKQVKVFSYSFASKILFNYMKLVGQKYLYAHLAAAALRNNYQNETVDKEIDNATSLGTVALHTILDYYSFNPLSRWGATLALHKGESLFEGGTDDKGKLEAEHEQKYKGLPGLDKSKGMLYNLPGDIFEDLSKGGETTAKDWEKYHITGEGGWEFTGDAMANSLEYLQIFGNPIPGGPAFSHFMREYDNQKNAARRNSAGAEDENGLKGTSLKGTGVINQSLNPKKKEDKKQSEENQ